MVFHEHDLLGTLDCFWWSSVWSFHITISGTKCFVLEEDEHLMIFIKFYYDHIFPRSFLQFSIVCRNLYSTQNYCNCVCLPPALCWSEAQDPHIISGIWEFREDQFEKTWAQSGMCGLLTVAIAVQFCGFSGKIYDHHTTYLWKYVVDILLSIFPLTHK